MSKPTNVVIAGLGGQGVLKASDILAEVAFSTPWPPSPATTTLVGLLIAAPLLLTDF